MRRRLRLRGRPSTWVLTAFFLVTLALYLQVRPIPPPAAGTPVVPAPATSPRRTPASTPPATTSRPASPVPATPTPTPTTSGTPSPVPTPTTPGPAALSPPD